MRAPLSALFLAATIAFPAAAHDFVVKPKAASGASIPVQVMLTEVFIVGDFVPPIENVTARVVSGGGASAVALTANAETKSLEGTAAAPSDAPFLVTAKLSRTRTPRPEAGRPPEPATLSENASKALLNLKPGATGFDIATGDRLEIVPLANPAELKVGDELPVKLLFDGKPFAGRILATYDGFSTREATYAYASAAEKDGLGYVKITAPGLWVVKTSHSLAETAPTYGRYSANANMVFTVR
ncbi:DUF4198 domain-containing protein [Aquabacter spiritensis]|uniref:Uncharacterized protein DUF4198 n=1 Tax=Aquabacter spiritensis TaxID=933073 RepID=A0A4V2UXS9_9HYPH|nr:DUF4198 domain-containing protein [Aquabacter spiritensis]TCT04688.1 uncharacterized protein DUF4198 [Aquabacter spiritensis]